MWLRWRTCPAFWSHQFLVNFSMFALSFYWIVKFWDQYSQKEYATVLWTAGRSWFSTVCCRLLCTHLLFLGTICEPLLFLKEESSQSICQWFLFTSGARLSKIRPVTSSTSAKDWQWRPEEFPRWLPSDSMSTQHSCSSSLYIFASGRRAEIR